MDEESAASAGDGGIDAQNIDLFDQWILADPAHLDQVLPEQRGVVALMARRKDRDYGSPWETAHRNEANHESWWLIRNGQNVYRMVTNFQVGSRLVPARNEFTDLFVDRFTKAPLEPGTHAWLEAEKRQGARERHFFKVALILQGLIDRTAVFAPLPAPEVSLLTPFSYDAGHVVLIADDENQLTTGRMPFRQWLTSKNSQLTPGMRVIVNTHHQSWPHRSQLAYEFDTHPRLTPPRASDPSRTAVHTISRREGPTSLAFHYERTDVVYTRDGAHTPKTRATCVIEMDDPFVLPVDLVTIEEMRAYLGARTERHAYAEMFPTLQAAIAFKEAEAATEAPFRDLLSSTIAGRDDITLDDAHAVVSELVTWWKLGNRWNRPLSGDAAAEAKAAAAILTEHAGRKNALSATSASAKVLADLTAAHRGALFIARKKDGTWVVASPSPRAHARTTDPAVNKYASQVAPLDVFVDIDEYTKTGKPRSHTPWKILEPAVVGRWSVLTSSKQWETWNRRARRAEHLSDPEIEQGVETLIARGTATGDRFVAALYREATRTDGRTNQFTLYTTSEQDLSAPQRPLTGNWPEVALNVHTATWSRAADGTVTLAVRRERSEWFSTGAFERRGMLNAPWEGHTGIWHVVRCDEELVASLKAAHLALAHRKKIERDPLAAEAGDVFASLERLWVAQQTAAAKARFLEDYQDMTLWEDHAKTVNIVWPYSTRSGSRHGRIMGALFQHVSALVEDGNAPWGLSVAQVLEQRATPMSVPDHWGPSPDRDQSIPQEILDLRFGPKPTTQD